MIRKITTIGMMLSVAVISFNCSNNDDDNEMQESVTTVYVQEDQMGRPAVNTVFVASADKDVFNKTIPSKQGAAFASKFKTNLEALSPAFNESTDKNALGQTSTAFTTLLATDVLNVSLDGTTTFYDGTNVLTGRALADDVITVELILIFGGESGLTMSENPTLSDDNVSANDKDFLTSFPYLASPW
ncbi:hypothetical protein AXE80_14100 [Wenyingzhuangia fucanilytica]|uniref:DUF4331 domain-containing protein n=1 Tax=Wenyingzhuangia fucanilytica TaxID=1790137 RepID=A0A1B1Y9A4_9FLAO|nr:DUF4331 family protein [Wenyingzhuangia fucanilytica]ANW97357.1 hypothetical protein AXE80_14100 [Wenyingzhuangia fucanilytica]